MAGGLASVIFGLHRIKLKTYERFTVDGVLPFTVALGLTALFLTSLPGLGFPVVGTLAFVLILFFAATACGCCFCTSSSGSSGTVSLASAC